MGIRIEKKWVIFDNFDNGARSLKDLLSKDEARGCQADHPMPNDENYSFDDLSNDIDGDAFVLPEETKPETVKWILDCIAENFWS